jgi:hypothetical protein
MDPFFWFCVLLACIAAITVAAHRTNKDAFTELNRVKEEQVKLSKELTLCKAKLAAEETKAEWFKSAYEKIGFELIEAGSLISNHDAELKAANLTIERLSSKLKDGTGADLPDWEFVHEVHSIHSD